MEKTTLSADQIDLWIVFEQDVKNEQLKAEYHRLMSEDERVKESRFYFARDRERYRTTRALVRSVLSRYAPVEPQDWKFDQTFYGKPIIANQTPATKGLEFNVTHTQGLIMLGVTSQHALGVDVESHRRRPVPVEVGFRFFSPREAKDVRESAAEMQAERFYEYWTLKESFLKAIGKGLSVSLDQITFSLTGNRIEAGFGSSLPESRVEWKFWQFYPSSEHIAAVCVEQAKGEEQRLSIRRVVPLSFDEPLCCALERSSEQTIH